MKIGAGRRGPRRVDLLDDDGVVLFGKHKGEYVHDVPLDYMEWCLENLELVPRGPPRARGAAEPGRGWAVSGTVIDFPHDGEEMVDALESFLELARAGTLESLAIVAVRRDNITCTSIATSDSHNQMALLGGATWLRARVQGMVEVQATDGLGGDG